MEEQHHEFIERYYRNALNEAEVAEFRRRFAGDTAFREAVQVHEDALEAIHLEGVAMLRARLAAKGRELDAGMDKPSTHGLWWVIGLLAVLLSCWALWWWMLSENSPATVPVIESRDLVTPPATDTMPALPPPDKQSEPAQKTPGHQRVFAAWFQPYKDPSLEPSRRGDAERSPSERFQKLYWDGDYPAALVAFDALDASAKNSDNLLFLKANCLMVTGKAAAASDLLNNILRNDRSRFRAQVSWYLALSHLQTGRIKEAETLLRRIVTDAGSPRQVDAGRLLGELK